MSKAILILAARNLAVLVFVALPVFIAAAWVQALLTQAHGVTDADYVLETGGFYYLVLLGPVLVGGILHQLLWLGLTVRWTELGRNVFALLMAPVIPAVLVAWGVDTGLMGGVIIPMVLALLVYGMLVKGPASPSAGERTGARSDFGGGR